MRVAIAEMKQETNSFVPFRTTVETFRDQYLFRGVEMLTGYGAERSEVPGMLDVLHAAGAIAVPLLGTLALASGPVTRECFEALLGEIVERLRAAGAVDGVLLALHGAMVVEDEPDSESEILERVRAVLPKGVPIVVTLDLHGHITQRMIQPDVAYIGYREYPHIDMYETGARGARLLLDWLGGRVRPVMAVAKRHMVMSPDAARTTTPPLADVVAAGRAMEAAQSKDWRRVLHVSLFPVQPWMDVPDLGFAALVCADGDVDTAQAAAEALAEMTWQRRAEFEPDLTPLEEVIRIGLSSEGLTVASDAGDTPTCANMRRIPFTRVTRPFYPMDWNAPADV